MYIIPGPGAIARRMDAVRNVANAAEENIFSGYQAML
jgi:hypothetical protein